MHFVFTQIKQELKVSGGWGIDSGPGQLDLWNRNFEKLGNIMVFSGPQDRERGTETIFSNIYTKQVHNVWVITMFNFNVLEYV
jgi:hypothetical protein